MCFAKMLAGDYMVVIFVGGIVLKKPTVQLGKAAVQP